MSRPPTRRRFLEAALAAASFGRAGGPQEASTRRLHARMVGDALERGHHWLFVDAERLHVDRQERREVVVVGAGIAGCVAAWRLLSAGVDDVAVLELEDKPGGLARGGLIGTTAFAFGGVTLAAPGATTSPAVRRLLEAARIDPAPVMAFAPAVWNGAAWAPWDVTPPRLARPESAPAALDRASVQDWIATGGTDARAAAFARRWCLARFGARPADVSAGAFLADAAARAGPEGGVLRVPGGLPALLQPLVEAIGGRLLPARVAVLARPERQGVVVRAVNAGDAVVTDYEARAAILAVPPFIAARLAPTLRQRQRLDVPDCTPWLVSAISVARWPRGFDPAVPLHQCVDERAALIHHAGDARSGVLVHHRPFPGAASAPARMFLRDLDREAAMEWVLRELEPVFPDLRELAERVEIMRIGHGPTRPAPGYASGVAPRLREPLPPVFPCGADYAGVPCAEAAVQEGVRGAEAVLAALGKPSRSWL
jgi:hypothetical protein